MICLDCQYRKYYADRMRPFRPRSNNNFDGCYLCNLNGEFLNDTDNKMPCLYFDKDDKLNYFGKIALMERSI